MNKTSAMRLLGLSADAFLKCEPYIESVPTVFDDKDSNMLGVIFSDDPVTGFPSSDFTSSLNGITNPEVVNFVRNVLQSPVTGLTGTDDIELAEELTYRRGESRDSYLDRVVNRLDIIKDNIAKARSIEELNRKNQESKTEKTE